MMGLLVNHLIIKMAISFDRKAEHPLRIQRLGAEIVLESAKSCVKGSC
jgi:hypothetical protein